MGSFVVATSGALLSIGDVGVCLGIIVREDRTKTKSSMRTLPLVDFIKEKLIAVKAEQEEYRKLCGRSYMKDYIGYICVNEIGDIIKPR